MSSTSSLGGDVYVNGSLGAKTLIPSAGCVTDGSVQALAGIAASKLEHRREVTYRQAYSTTAAADRQTVHVIYGATGTIVAVKAGLSQAAAGNATTTIKLRKNGTDVLSADISLTSSLTAFQLSSAAGFSDDSLAQGDVLEVDVSVNAGTGTLGKGVFVLVVLDEDAQ